MLDISNNIICFSSKYYSRANGTATFVRVVLCSRKTVGEEAFLFYIFFSSLIPEAKAQDVTLASRGRKVMWLLWHLLLTPPIPLAVYDTRARKHKTHSAVGNEGNTVSDIEHRPVLVVDGPSIVFGAGVSPKHAPFGKSSIRPLSRPVDVRPVV